MDKKELIKKVAETTGKSSKDVKDVLETVLSVISDTVDKGEPMSLKDFGVFKIVTYAARRGVKPRTKEPIEIPATERVRFSAYGKFRLYSRLK